MAPPSPLVAADLKKINQAMAELNNLIIEMDKADKAGVDTAERRQARDTLYHYLEQFKTVYFPGK